VWINAPPWSLMMAEKMVCRRDMSVNRPTFWPHPANWTLVGSSSVRHRKLRQIFIVIVRCDEAGCLTTQRDSNERPLGCEPVLSRRGHSRHPTLHNKSARFLFASLV
jgi:hypothetical protein